MSVHIFPGSSLNNRSDCRWVNSELPGNLSQWQRLRQLANLSCLIRSKARSSPSTNVLRMGNLFEMIRVHARSVPTQVVKVKSFLGRTVLALIENAMRVPLSPIGANHPVPVRVSGSTPLPASGRVVHNVLDRATSVLMPGNESDVLARNSFGPEVGACRYRSDFATPAHAKSRRIGRRRQLAPSERLHAFHRAEAGRLHSISRNAKSLSAVFTDNVIRGILGAHMNHLSCATPPVAPTTRGLSCAPIIPDWRD